jgi:enamine deaminase RidA (YjgF/YER057c/UK114 family)
MERRLINPPGTEALYKAWQFSQAVRVGDTVWVSGQVGIGSDGSPAQGIEAQARAAFQGLERVLREAGGSLADVVELTTFHTSMGDMAGFGKAKAEFFRENYPAWTAVGVTTLALPGLEVEVRATAVIGSGSVAQS